MKIPLSWLKEYLDLKISAEEISSVLTLAGLEVEGIDPVLEISLTPNLGHCMSVLGVARELAAHLDLPLNTPPVALEEDPKLPIRDLIDVEVQDREHCLRYACRVIFDIKVGPSPKWLSERLESCGIRSVNNIVDCGNYVMLECGQPLHIYDYDQIAGKKILLSSTLPYVSIDALDGQTYSVVGALTIADAKGPIGLAGMLGGGPSSVSDNTRNVLIESALFSPVNVRKTAKRLGIRTEGSQRFEKGTDFEMVVPALNRVTALIAEVAGGRVAKGCIDQVHRPYHPKEILCRTARVNQILGTQLSQNEVAACLKRLGIRPVKEAEGKVYFTPPSYRNDLMEEIDLIEEVARVYGYGNIPQKAPLYSSSTLAHAPIYLFENTARAQLLSESLSECLTCDLISPDQAGIAPDHHPIHVLHPRSVDQSVLRTSLLPGLLQVVKYNLDHQNNDFSGFEVGRVHIKSGDTYFEPSMAALILTGHAAPHHFSQKSRETDFFDLKGKVENLLKALGAPEACFEPSHFHPLHPGRQARIKIGDLTVGSLGEVHPSLTRLLSIGQRTYFAEINLNDLLPLSKKERKFVDIAPYPGSQRDWTITLKESAPIETVFDAVKALHPKLLEKMSLLDLYKSEQIGKDRKNATFRFFYRDLHQTLSLEQVEKVHAFLTEEVAKKLKDWIY